MLALALLSIAIGAGLIAFSGYFVRLWQNPALDGGYAKLIQRLWLLVVGGLFVGYGVAYMAGR